MKKIFALIVLAVTLAAIINIPDQKDKIIGISVFSIIALTYAITYISDFKRLRKIRS